MWTGLITLIGGLGKSWLDRHNRVAEAKTEASIKRAAAVVEQAGWKDEFVVIIWSIPAIMAFIPGGQRYAMEGFENLRQAPEWYIIGWVSISLAVYGIKPATKQIMKWRRGDSPK